MFVESRCKISSKEKVTNLTTPTMKAQTFLRKSNEVPLTHILEGINKQLKTIKTKEQSLTVLTEY